MYKFHINLYYVVPKFIIDSILKKIRKIKKTINGFMFIKAYHKLQINSSDSHLNNSSNHNISCFRLVPTETNPSTKTQTIFQIIAKH